MLRLDEGGLIVCMTGATSELGAVQAHGDTLTVIAPRSQQNVTNGRIL